MIDLWLLREGLAPSPALTGIEDHTRLQEIIRDEVRIWYGNLLLTAIPSLLPQEDIAEEVSAVYRTRNAALLTLPRRCVRPLVLRMEDWTYEVCDFPLVDAGTSSREMLRALCSTPHTPHAYLRPDGVIEAHGLDRDPAWDQYHTPLMKPSQKVPVVSTLTAVCRPADGSYIFDQTLV